MPNHFLTPLMKKGAEHGASLVVRETGATLATTIEVAFESAARKRGLLGRASLDPGHALIIAPCSAVHTFGMQFPIDVVFVAKDGKILKITRDMGRGRVAASLRAFATIEVRAGTVELIGVKSGQILEVL
jgi:uncharacterized membrane protein (UPF0127 family)